ncbi:MAG: hypothetical protein A2776_01965 [Candidatus Levybacteria bacterium RIFCSPHIGHO2_01_FULL_40_10]|nr:MAG: hypothetical protein A2776_01965 [Candidatus Levybacteria bacterium RIFCSPHIGHO2_01_FULL_40_10]
MEEQSQPSPANKKAFFVLASEFAVFVVFVSVAGYLTILKTPVQQDSSSQNVQTKEEVAAAPSPTPTPNSTIKIEESYSNPFATETQYVNPFGLSNNPFNALDE